jgi:Icc-related predicted phosphoesterase
MIARMTPRLLWNRFRRGRALDVLITHSPPRDVNDRPDPAHRGFKAIRTFLRWFKPAYQLHGHVHLYDRSVPFCAHYEETSVVNVYPYRVVDIKAPVATPVARSLAEPS